MNPETCCSVLRPAGGAVPTRLPLLPRPYKWSPAANVLTCASKQRRVGVEREEMQIWTPRRRSLTRTC
ncbi:hypothetical protein OJAV_G00218180 [Oryzias javanicus]|uniref:Uncharacterized protein n=1 Tax=Oryzias javanicus TaxID=123683 RepID=A0A437C4L3_ORYJA|nr:hypothetical protein OJAV_G00218180 [Oryzias javanicus]